MYTRTRAPRHGDSVPASLQQLSLGEAFNQPIAGVVWPTSLQQLSFAGDFNQPIVGDLWLASLQQLAPGFSFNHPHLLNEATCPLAPAIVLRFLRPAHCWSCVAVLPAAAIFRGWPRRAHQRR